MRFMLTGKLYRDMAVYQSVLLEFFTARKRSCGKISFSQASVCTQGGLPSHYAMGQAEPPYRETPL